LSPISWILVDWIGTITDIRSTVVPELERFGKRCRIHADWDHFMDAWGLVQRIFLDRIVSGESPWRPQAEILLDAFKETLLEAGGDVNQVPLSALQYLVRFTAYMKPWDDSRDGIAMLRVLAPVALYSLSPLESLAMQTAEADMTFDHLISAEPYRSYPPAAEGFRGAATELEVPATEIIFLSAHPPMLRGAEAAGMQVLQIERPARNTRLILFEPTTDLHIQGKPRDLCKAAEWLAVRLSL
jgi:FMN phosphatase YigB (HAD superfamily)